MRFRQLVLLLALAIPLVLWLGGCGRAVGQNVDLSATGEPCICTQAGSAPYGTFRDDAPTATQWWLPPDSHVPFEVLGADDKRLISAVPLSPEDEYSILLRVGRRAQRTGDSRTLGFFSEEIHDPGDTESQALYGINIYSGSSKMSQLGVHGMAQSKPGPRQAISTIVGTQGFAAHVDQGGGLTNNVVGVSGVGQTGASEEVNGVVHNMIGVQGHSQSRSATRINQAISVYGRAPEISGGGTVGMAAGGRFDQPAGASHENHAIIVSGEQDRLSIGFKLGGSKQAAKTIAWQEDSRSFEFSEGVRLAVYTSTNRPAPGVPGKLIFNTDHGNINIDTGKGWILPGGEPAD